MTEHDLDADVIVIGSGIAGLTAGALLAYTGRRVVVCEQADGLGGYAHAFQRGDHGQYTFDPAVHLLADQQLFGGVLQLLGVRDSCTFIPSEHFYRAILPDYAIDLPADREGYVETHVEAFPHEAEGIRGFWEMCRTVHREAHDMPAALHLRDLDAAVAAAPNMFRYRQSTLADVLDEYIDDPRAKAVCAVPWQYLGVPPSMAAFQTFAQLTTVHTDDLFAIEGGVERLIHALADAITSRGGAIRTGCRVTAIPVSDGRARGVTLADGEELHADWVLSGADPFQTFEQLVADEHVPSKYLRKLSRMRVSGSAFLLFAASRLDLSAWDLPHQIFTHASWDHEESYRMTSVGDFGVRWITPTSLLDPSVAPEGEHIVVCKAITPYDVGTPWADIKERCTQKLLGELDTILPGFTDDLTFVESATPLTVERFSLNRGGAIHSWEQTPAHTESKRPTPVTPVDHLLLCSQWTSIGGSFLRSFFAGIMTAQILLDQSGAPDALPDFRAVPQA
ncbi:MAG: NAD(P)/FAD-dependent oxidoreductase [Egibacteraceae bacterium]